MAGPKKRARRTLQRAADGVRVELRLRGWPREVRLLSVVEEYWCVELCFTTSGSNVVRIVTYFETDDYEQAYSKYQALLPIVTVQTSKKEAA